MLKLNIRFVTTEEYLSLNVIFFSLQSTFTNLLLVKYGYGDVEKLDWLQQVTLNDLILNIASFTKIY